MEPLISVIVPIYNVAPYLRKCLDSLKNQTLKQIEVICIDDGSTDSSGRIAEEYKHLESFPLFRVIHTENCGLSAARNLGIDEARAKWLMFVDSDDWVEPEFCELPHKRAVDVDADMVIFDTKEDGLADEITAHDYGGTTVWNKLYRKTLFDNIRYPSGRVYEDIATTHKLVHKAKRKYLLSDSLYHRVRRKGSITQNHTRSSIRDNLISAIERKDDLIKYGYPVKKLQNYACGVAISFLARNDDFADPYMVKAKEIVNNTEGIPRNLSRKQKIALKSWKTDERLFYFLAKVSGRFRKQTQGD